MEKYRFNKFYRVFRNDTKVTEVSFNDFKPVIQASKASSLKEQTKALQAPSYALAGPAEMFYGYEFKTNAMEMAKSGALKHIAALIAEGPASEGKVYQYRFDHYEDLNINLRDSAIRQITDNIN